MLLLLLCLLSLACGQATRTWVSGVGDDANPCSRTAPCKTFAGAISKTAAAGEIDTLDSGGFGAPVITKSITIDGGGTLAGVLQANFVITASSTDTVVLRRLTFNGLNGLATAITINQAGSVVIEEVDIVYVSCCSSV